MKSNHLYIKMFLYFAIALFLSFGTELDKVDIHNISSVTAGDWLKIGVNTLGSGLLVLRAFMDTSMGVAQQNKLNTETKTEEK